MPFDGHGIVRPEDSRPGGQRHTQFGLIGLHFQENGILLRLPGFQGLEVQIVQVPVALNAVVDDATIKRRSELDPSRPVFGDKRGFQPCQMRLAHVDKTTFNQAGYTPQAVREANGAQ